MTKREVRRAIRERKRALSAELARAKARVRAELKANPALRQRARRRLRRRLATATTVLVLLLALLQRCACGPAPAVDGGVSDAGPDGGADAGAQRDGGVRPLTGPRLSKQHRGDLQLDGVGPPAWIDELRLQVAARSPKLAECFKGAEKPGTLRWTCSVSPGNGMVSDHELEMVGDSYWLPGQRECVLQVLSHPPYHFKAPPPSGSTPSRVSLVLEF